MFFLANSSFALGGIAPFEEPARAWTFQNLTLRVHSPFLLIALSSLSSSFASPSPSRTIGSLKHSKLYSVVVTSSIPFASSVTRCKVQLPFQRDSLTEM